MFAARNLIVNGKNQRVSNIFSLSQRTTGSFILSSGLQSRLFGSHTFDKTSSLSKASLLNSKTSLSSLHRSIVSSRSEKDRSLLARKFSSRADSEGPNFQQFFDKNKRSIGIVLLSLGAFALLTTALSYSTNGNEIDWVTFKTKILSKGEVDHLDVYTNTKRVCVYIKSLTQGFPNALDNSSTVAYQFSVDDVASFEKKLREAQKEMGSDVTNYIPVNYKVDGAVEGFGVFWSVAPFIVIVGFFVYFFRSSAGASKVNSIGYWILLSI